jgi:glucose-6-phosphate isomerase
MAIRLDDARMMAAAVPSGITPSEWNDLSLRFGDVHRAVAADAAAGRYGFTELESQAAEFTRVREFSRRAAQGVDDVVVLGIGGSALGTVALRTALGGTGGGPRLHVLDNVDPAPMAQLLTALTPDRTLWCVVSKSGTTVETLAQYALVRAWIERAGVPPARHLAFVTDPLAGPLRAIAKRDGIPAFSVPPNVGGRFSVLTPVGTLPAALAGYDVAALLAGARAMRDRCATPTLGDNPAGGFAALLWRAHQRAGQGTHVFMPYADGLRDVAPWFVQLWAESLGKKDADGLPVGPTPLGARGATDQHSLLQLLMEGPADKVVAFVRVAHVDDDLTVPAGGDVPDAAAFVRGRSLGELLGAEADATAKALVSAGRPSLTLLLERCDAHGVGQLLMMLMLATVYAGAFYRVDPLGQPGVELGKRLAREALST